MPVTWLGFSGLRGLSVYGKFLKRRYPTYDYRTMTSSNYTSSNCKAIQQGRDHLLNRKLDKGSSNKPLNPATVTKLSQNFDIQLWEHILKSTMHLTITLSGLMSYNSSILAITDAFGLAIIGYWECYINYISSCGKINKIFSDEIKTSSNYITNWLSIILSCIEVTKMSLFVDKMKPFISSLL
ncbi:hypothetical protein H8356DRAFT_1348784 [Neocallimastix lanati (nom. inval.)]|nr:hypothetical protein H8356DRAFT_1348784 [Neocallimastix sp. JGI-2020a]